MPFGVLCGRLAEVILSEMPLHVSSPPGLFFNLIRCISYYQGAVSRVIVLAAWVPSVYESSLGVLILYVQIRRPLQHRGGQTICTFSFSPPGLYSGT